MPEEEKKTPLEAALEKECIFLVMAWQMSEDSKPDCKCMGPKCAQFDWFNARCGFSK